MMTEDTPIAVVCGEPFLILPRDLYIPPEALQVFLQTFSGPLDLLLYLIKKQNLDILDIPIAQITEQYMAYVEVVKTLQLELAAEYLVMAATLASIKSRLLLPRPALAETEEDPRAELIRRLQEYEQIRNAAEYMDELPRLGRDTHLVAAEVSWQVQKPLPVLELPALLAALADILRRTELSTDHVISREPLSVRERMGRILSFLSTRAYVDFRSLFDGKEGRQGVVVSFLALLELLKEMLIEIVQVDSYGVIHVRARG